MNHTWLGLGEGDHERVVGEQGGGVLGFAVRLEKGEGCEFEVIGGRRRRMLSTKAS